jgi:hypothetical protein
VVCEGVSGHIRKSTSELAECVKDLNLPASIIRGYMEKHFSLDKMTRKYTGLYRQILREDVAAPARVVA